jgi:hypothetical protein
VSHSGPNGWNWLRLLNMGARLKSPLAGTQVSAGKSWAQSIVPLPLRSRRDDLQSVEGQRPDFPQAWSIGSAHGHR